MVISAKYDFVVPSGLGDDLFAKISSSVKNRLMLDNSGHYIHQWDLTMDEMLKFITANK